MERMPAPDPLPPAGTTGDALDTAVDRSRRRYAACWLAMPALVFAAAFALLCLEECTAAPWLAFLLAPLASALLGLVAAVCYWRWSAVLPDAARRSVRRYILLSIAWGPLAGLAGFVILATTASVGIGVLAMFR
ncbi:hypothetical protein [Pseudoxanthomonas sp. 10H]|uniref:hypothetical protein n=1 Tax=Pseudoxanthomonas sp. 10H TaxID=3242729 RepID=UPI00355894AF